MKNVYCVCVSFKRFVFDFLLPLCPSLFLSWSSNMLPSYDFFLSVSRFLLRPVSCTSPFFLARDTRMMARGMILTSNPYFFVINFGCGPTDLRSRRGGLSSNNEAASSLQHEIQRNDIRHDGIIDLQIICSYYRFLKYLSSYKKTIC